MFWVSSKIDIHRSYDVILQVIIQLVGLLCVAASISKEKKANTFAISTCVVGLISLLMGEMG